MVERLNGIQEVGSSNLLPSTKSRTPPPRKGGFLLHRRRAAYMVGRNMKEITMILAYIDPGSGSILIQVILASCIGGIAVFWQKIKSFFVRKKPEDPKKPE